MSSETILLPIERIKLTTDELLQKKKSLENDPHYQELDAIVEENANSDNSDEVSLSTHVLEVIEGGILKSLSEYQRLYNSLLTRMIQRHKISSRSDLLHVLKEIKHFAYRIKEILSFINQNIYRYPPLDFSFDESQLSIKTTIKKKKASINEALKIAEQERNMTVQAFWDQVADLQSFFPFIGTSRDNDENKSLINNNLKKFVDELENEFKDIFIIKDCLSQLEDNLKILAGFYKHGNVEGKEKADYCEENCNYFSLNFNNETNHIRLVQDQNKKTFIPSKEFLLLLADIKRINRRVSKDLIARARKMLFEKEAREFPGAIWRELMKIDISQVASFDLISQDILQDRPKKELELINSTYEDILSSLQNVYGLVQDEINQGDTGNDTAFSLIINAAELTVLYEFHPSAPKSFRRVSAQAVRKLFLRYKKFWSDGRKKMRIVQMNSQQLLTLIATINHHKKEVNERINELLFVEDDTLSSFIFWSKNTFQKIIESRVPDDVITSDKLEIVFEIMMKIVNVYNAGHRKKSDVIKECPLSMEASQKDVKRGTVPLYKATEFLLVALAELAILGNQTLFNPTSNILLTSK